MNNVNFLNFLTECLRYVWYLLYNAPIIVGSIIAITFLILLVNIFKQC